MLLTEKVMVKWNGANRKWYESKGYTWTKSGDEFEVRIEDLSKGSKSFLEIKCDCKDCKNPYLKPIKYEVYNRYVKEDGKYYCQECSTNLFSREKMNKTKIKNGKSFEQWCYDNNRLDVLDRWDYTLNYKLPSEVNCKTETRFYFKCPRGLHESELKSINSLVQNSQGDSMECFKCNSFAMFLIDTYGVDGFNLIWSNKNNINPWNITKSCREYVYINCLEYNYHGSYKILCNSFYGGERCGYCSNHKVHPKDSLGQYIIDNYGEEFLDKIWSDKNDKSPFEYKTKSSQKFWWKCLEGKHEDYERNACQSNDSEFRCSECISERTESILQEKVRLYLEYLGYETNHEYKTEIKCINPKTKRQLPYDNEVVNLNLVIEVMGQQHYKESSGNFFDENFDLFKLRVHDRYKRLYAKYQGYNYLEIPYWTDNKQEEWKQLIDNKIQEIKGGYN